MPAIPEVTAASFERRVLQCELPVLVAVCANGTRAREPLLTLLEAWIQKACGGINVVWVNATASPDLVQRCGVLSAPGLALFSQGTAWYQFSGELSRRELDDLLAQANRLTRTASTPARATKVPTLAAPGAAL